MRQQLQGMLMRTQLYQINLAYRKVSTMYLADTLSRAYLPDEGDHEVAKEIESTKAIQDIRITAKKLEEVKEHTQRDEVLQELIRKLIIQTGWPERKADVAHPIAPKFGIRHELSVYEGIVVRS